MSPVDPTSRRWLLVSKHGLALLQLARKPTSSAREVADAIGLGERQAQRLLRDLLDADYVRKRQVGRRNEYQLVENARMRHPMLAHVAVKPLLDVLLDNLEAAEPKH
jgi:DNA-binding transcriptional ArsR family regulator